jgi:hypothetical protein
VTRASDSLDPDLVALFADDRHRFDDQPFVATTLQRVRRRRIRTAVTAVMLRVVGIAAIVALSPVAIRLSLETSVGLDRVFTTGAGFVTTPLWIALAAAGGIGVVILVERRRPGVLSALLFDLIH